jgi:deoxyribose-phosphate aldolase
VYTVTESLAKLIDHTALKPDTTKEQIEQLCREAKEFGFVSVCINPTWVKRAADLLEGSDVKVCTVIGFPLGATTAKVKQYETKDAIENGATEVDMVINIGALKDGNDNLVFKDIQAVVEAAKGEALTKVIIETCLLNDEEKKRACDLAVRAGADFVKTSTGFSSRGATAADVFLMRKAVGPDIGVKASGGVRDLRATEEMINAGATRIGASSGVSIIKEQQSD